MTESKPPTFVVWGVLLLAVLAVSSSAPLVRGMEDIGPLAIAFWRTALAGLVALPWAGRVAGPDGVRIAMAGALLAIHFGSWYASLSLTTVIRSTVLVSTGPAFVGLFQLLTNRLGWGGERPSWRFWIGVALAASGTALFVTDGTAKAETWKGDLLAILGAISVAGYYTLGGSVRGRVDLASYAAYSCLSAAACLLAATTLSGGSLVGFPQTTWLLLGLAVIGPQGLGHNGFNYALKFLSARVVSSMTLLEPVGAALLTWAIFSETPPLLAVVGAAIVLTGVGVAQWK